MRRALMVLSLLSVACGGPSDPVDPDGGVRDGEAVTPRQDGGTAWQDARVDSDGSAPDGDGGADAATPPTDAGPGDGGEVDADAGGRDAGPGSDAGPGFDAGPCAPLGDGTLDVDVTTVTLSGALTVNGARAAGSGGRVYLHDPLTGDVAPLGDPAQDSYTARVIPGVYDVRYGYAISYLFEPDAVGNTDILVRRGVVVDESSTTLDVDIEAVTIRGSLRVAGEPAPGWGGGYLELRNPATGDTARITSFDEATYEALVAPGTYDLYYEGHSTSGLLRNENLPLQTGVVVGEGTVLDVDLPVAELRGELTLPPSSSAQHGGFVELVSESGDRARLGSVYRDGTNGIRYYADVAPGIYDAHYVMPDSDLNMGAVRNTDARFATGVEVTGDAELDLVVPAVRFSGNFTIGGVDPPSGGRIYARSADAEDEAFVGFPNSDGFAANLVAGTYDLYYVTLSARSADDTLRNADALVMPGVDLTADRYLVEDISIVELTGDITVNGAALTSGRGRASIWRGDADRAWLGYVSNGSYRAYVLPGVYDLVYDGDRLPYEQHDGVRNDLYTLSTSVAVTASMTLDVDIPASALSGRLTIDGGTDPFPASRFFLRRVGTEDEAFLGEASSFESTYDALVVPGRYYLVHAAPSNRSLGGQVRNEGAILGCVEVP